MIIYMYTMARNGYLNQNTVNNNINIIYKE